MAYDMQQLRGELSDFRGAMTKDIRSMFDQHEAMVRQLFEPTPDRLPLKPFLAPNLPSPTANPMLLQCGDAVFFEHLDKLEKDEPTSPCTNGSASGLAAKEKQQKKEEEELLGDLPSERRRKKAEHDEEEEEWFGDLHKSMGGVFGDLGTMDHYDFVEPVYHVYNFYKTEGFAQKVARSIMFENITLAVISANAIYLGIDTDRNDAGYILDADWYFQAFDHLFCAYFTAELVIRFAAFKWKRDCLRDGWFKFDSFLVGFMVAETWVMPVIFSIIGGSMTLPLGPLRLLRLLRLSRLVRLIRMLPELLTMFKGMFVASRAVGSSMLMVLLLLYVFGIVIHMGLAHEEELEEQFKTLPLCMWTLFISGTLMDETGGVLTGLLEMGKFNTVLSTGIFLLFILLSATTVMNMLIGVLCEVVSAVAQSERDEAALNIMKESILIELQQFDHDGNNMISKDELEFVMKSRKALGVLSSIDVDSDCLSFLQQMLFFNKEGTAEIHIERIMELLLNYRGNLSVTVKHLVDAMTFTRWCITEKIDAMGERIEGCLRELCSRQAASPTTNTTALRQAAWPIEPRERALTGKSIESITRSAACIPPFEVPDPEDEYV